MDEYEDKSCALYVEGFDIVHTYVRKHHPEIDLSTLDFEEVEREVANRAIVAQANDMVGEEAEAPIDDLVDLVDLVDPIQPNTFLGVSVGPYFLGLYYKRLVYFWDCMFWEKKNALVMLFIYLFIFNYYRCV